MNLAFTILLFTGVLGQCPNYSAQWIVGQSCGPLGSAGATAWGMSGPGHLLAGQASNCQGDLFAVSWQPGGQLTPVPFPVTTTYSRAHDVNQDGVVVGEVDALSQGARNGFKSQDGQTVFLPPDAGGIASAEAVNSAGLVVGWSNGGGLHAMYWVDTTGVSLQPDLPLGPNSAALDVNDQGQICGWMGGNGNPHPDFPSRPFIWHNGKSTTLPIPKYAAGDWGAATAINNRGDACGYFFVTHPEKTYVRRACAWIDGQCIDLGILPDADASIALDINDAREVIGYCTAGPSAGGAGAFIWRDGVMHNLIDLLPPDVFHPLSIHPRAINNTGQIAGGAGLLPDNDGVAFRLTPALSATPGDTDCSGSVNIDDLLTVIGQWDAAGPVGGRSGDVNRDNRIDLEDLLQILRHWTS